MPTHAVHRLTIRAAVAAAVLLLALGAPAVADPLTPPAPSAIVGSVVGPIVNQPVGVPLDLPAPCIVDLRTVPTQDPVDVAGTPVDLPNVGNNMFASPYGPEPATSPWGASTAPVAWNDGAGASRLGSASAGVDMGWHPTADAKVAADDAYVVQAVNSRIRMTHRGSGLSNTYDLSTFFAAPPTCMVGSPAWPTVSHPDIWITGDASLYHDFRTGRWFASAVVLRNTSDGHIEGTVRLAVSQTADPLAGYALYTVNLPRGSDWMYLKPKFAVTDDKVVFTWHSYWFNNFEGTETVVLPKLPLLGATPGVGTVIGPDPNRAHVIPATQLSGGTAAHLATLGTNGTLVFETIDGSPPLQVTTTTYQVGVRPWTAAPMSRQHWGTLIDSGGGVLQAPVFRDGTWWGSVTEGCQPVGASEPVACVRMWQLQIDATGAPQLRQEFDIGQAGVDYSHPASGIDADGNLAVILARMTGTGHPGFVVVGQAKGSPLNTIGRSLYTKEGQARVEAATSWGAGGAAATPDGGMWLTHQYAGTGGWGTELIELRPASFSARQSAPRLTINPGSTATSTLTLASLRGWSGAVALSSAGVPSSSTVSIAPGSVAVPEGGTATATITISVGIAQSTDFTVTVTACGGGECQDTDIVVGVKRFSLGGPTVTVEPGTTAVNAVTVISHHGFTGNVALRITGAPSTTDFTLDSANVTVSANGTASTYLRVTPSLDEKQHEFTVIFEGCTTYCRSIPLTMQIKQFIMYTTAANVALAPGETGTGVVEAMSRHGWTGPVDVTLSNVPAGTTASASPSRLSVAAWGGQSKVEVTVTMGPSQTTAFYLYVTGCASFCRSSWIYVHPPQPTFQISAPARMDVPRGGSATATVSVTSTYGFEGTVTLTPSGAPSGSSATVSPRTVSLLPGETKSVTLTVSVSSGQSADFVVRVVATNTAMTMTRTADITVHPLLF